MIFPHNNPPTNFTPPTLGCLPGCHPHHFDEVDVFFFQQRFREAICGHFQPCDVFHLQEPSLDLFHHPLVPNIDAASASLVERICDGQEGVETVGKEDSWCGLRCPAFLRILNTHFAESPPGVRLVNSASMSSPPCPRSARASSLSLSFRSIMTQILALGIVRLYDREFLWGQQTVGGIAQDAAAPEWSGGSRSGSSQRLGVKVGLHTGQPTGTKPAAARDPGAEGTGYAAALDAPRVA